MIKNNKVIKKIYEKIIEIRNYILTIVSPKTLNKILYEASQGKKLNLKDPKLFNEKLMYLKLNDYEKNELYAKCTDKYEVRNFVEKNGCAEILNTLYGVYENANEIKWEELPQKFVLKATHGCGWNIICTDKEKLDKEETIKQLNKWISKVYGYQSAETHYFKIKPRIICEKYLETDQGVLPNDYKFFCFHGEPKLIETCTDRANKVQLNFMDLNWNKVDNIYPDKYISKTTASRPDNLGDMVEYARKLSKPFKFVRVDLYNVNGNTVFGELTFTPAGCTQEFTEEASKILGDWICLDNSCS